MPRARMQADVGRFVRRGWKLSQAGLPSAARMQARRQRRGGKVWGTCLTGASIQSRRPNKRVELTPLRGPKLAAFLKEGNSSALSRSIGAAQLTRRAFGGSSSYLYPV